MGVRHLASAIAVVLSLGAIATPLAGSPSAPPAERTHPRVRPASGGRPTSFAVLFSLREAPGHQGVLLVEYHVAVSPPANSPPSCALPQPAPVEQGEAGSVARVTLTSPPRGWCLGRYRATVYLQRGPYCPPLPVQAEPSRVACPLFATQELDTGGASFTVRPKHPQE